MSYEPNNCGIATHYKAKILLHPDSGENRIYTAMNRDVGRNVILTLTIDSLSEHIEAIVHVFVNGFQIPDGEFSEKGVVSRTFWLEGVVTIDLVVKEAKGYAKCKYQISLPVPCGIVSKPYKPEKQ